MNEITRVTLKGGAVIDTAMTPDEVLRTYREALNREAPEDKPDEQPDQTMTLVTEEKHGEYTVRTETSFDSNLLFGLGEIQQVEAVEEKPAPAAVPQPKSQNGKRVMSEETKEKMREARQQYWAEVHAGKRPAPQRNKKAAAAA